MKATEDEIQPSRDGATTYGVLDLETRPDEEAIALAGGRSAGRIPAGLHAVSAAAMLTAVEDADGGWRVFELMSVAGPPLREDELLRRVDGFLCGLGNAGGRLVTYNGSRHDLGLLRRRAARHWLFDCSGIADTTTADHFDLFRGLFGASRSEWPSLRGAAAALRISCDPSPPTSNATPLQIRKCETDVATTFVLLLHELAMRRRDAAVVARGWSALADHLSRPSVRAPHLVQFVENPVLRAAIEAGLADAH